jgi:hypothetical protein
VNFVDWVLFFGEVERAIGADLLGKLCAQTSCFHLEKIGVKLKIDWTRAMRGLKFMRRDHHSSCYHSHNGFGP